MIRIHREDIVTYDLYAEAIEWFDRHFPSGVAKFRTSKELLLYACATRGAECVGCWASEAGITFRLSNAQLGCANLRRARLRRADLSFAHLLAADLRSADLRGADLSFADLSFADLRYSDLFEADLRSADLRGADLTGALRHDPDPPIPDWVAVEGRLVRR